MKIGKEVIHGLTQKVYGSGICYYWEPSPAERKKGWKTLTLPSDLVGAITAARRRNDELESWKAGGATPRAVAKFTKASTFGAAIDQYEREKLARLSVNSRRVDATQINRLREWAGDQPVGWITRERVRVLRKALCPGGEGTPGHGVAFKTLSKGRDIFAWLVDQELASANPFERFGLGKPAARRQVWTPVSQEYFRQAADQLGWRSIALAMRIAVYTGQRESDILKLTRIHWRPVTLLHLKNDRALFDALVSDHGPDAGRVMGIAHIQQKTGTANGVPIEGELREALEAAIDAATERAKKTGDITSARIVAHDKSGAAWGQRDFIDRFGDVRGAAIKMAVAEGDAETAEMLATLQFRDFRRTCVVTLGDLGLDDFAISAITGHKLATIKAMLEVYGPRNQFQAARGVVARITPSGVEINPTKSRI